MRIHLSLKTKEKLQKTSMNIKQQKQHSQTKLLFRVCSILTNSRVMKDKRETPFRMTYQIKTSTYTENGGNSNVSEKF